MFRSFLLAALLLAAGADATAQTAPTKRTTAKKPVRRTAAKPARKPANTTLAPKPEAPDPGISRPTGSTATADGKGQGVYAAPGTAVQVQTGTTAPYRGEAPAQNPRPDAAGNTMGSGSAPARPASNSTRSGTR